MIEDMLYRFNGQDWSSKIRSIRTNIEINPHTFSSNDQSISFSVFDSSNQDESQEYLVVLYRLKCGPIRILCECKKRHFSPSLEDSIILQQELYSVDCFKSINKYDDHVSIEYNDDISINITYKPFQLIVLKASNSRKLLSLNTHSTLSIGINSVDFTYYSNNENPIRLIGLPARDSHVFLTPTIIEKQQQSNVEIKGEPYRIFNCDTGGFRPPKEYSVYGAINFLQSDNSAVFYSNSSDTFVDLIHHQNSSDNNIKDQVDAHFLSESGPIDLFLFIGNRLQTTHQFTNLTGSTFFPSLSNFGFGHCKWGIKDQEESESIIKLYDQSNVLLDTFWLDIDHLDMNMPFTVDKKRFPQYDEFIDELKANGLRRNVAIIEDPHLPFNKNHEIAEDCISKNLYVTKSDKKIFVGKCWPDDSIYPDFINDKCRFWWGTKVPLNVNQWNDMNEPSVFNVTENTMPRDNIHKCHYIRNNDKCELINKSNIEKIGIAYSNACNCCLYNDNENIEKDNENENSFYSFVQHRDVHNVYGHFHCLSTFNGVKERTKNVNDISGCENRKRPFVLTRSYFAGTSKHAAVWTGDQPSTLKDLQTSFHQVCTASVCAMPYIGADIGGFFGNPDRNLLELWFVNAVWFYPFLRLHGVLESLPRQELVASSDLIKLALNERYLFVPYWYTVFYQLHINKSYKNKDADLAVRFAFIDTPEIFGVYKDDYSCCELSNIGDSILVSPVYNFNSNSEKFEFENQKIESYVNSNYVNMRKVLNDLINQKKILSTSFNLKYLTNLLPLFIRKGKIVPIFTNPNKSIAITRKNKMCLIIALNDEKFAEGSLFLDDGDTFNFQSGDFAYRNFVCMDGKIKNVNLNDHSKFNIFNESFKNATIGSFVIISNKDDVLVKENLDLKILDDWEVPLN